MKMDIFRHISTKNDAMIVVEGSLCVGGGGGGKRHHLYIICIGYYYFLHRIYEFNFSFLK